MDTPFWILCVILSHCALTIGNWTIDGNGSNSIGNSPHKDNETQQAWLSESIRTTFVYQFIHASTVFGLTYIIDNMTIVKKPFLIIEIKLQV